MPYYQDKMPLKQLERRVREVDDFRACFWYRECRPERTLVFFRIPQDGLC